MSDRMPYQPDLQAVLEDLWRSHLIRQLKSAEIAYSKKRETRKYDTIDRVSLFLYEKDKLRKKIEELKALIRELP